MRSIEKPLASATASRYLAPFSCRPGKIETTSENFENDAVRTVNNTLSSATTQNEEDLARCNCKDEKIGFMRKERVTAEKETYKAFL